MAAAAVLATLAGALALLLVLRGNSGSDDPFPRGAAFRERVVAEPRLDPDGEGMARLLAVDDAPLSMNVGSFGQPVYVADDSTPRHELVVRREGPDDWGRNVLSELRVPVPDGAQPSTGSDGKLVVVSPDDGVVYDLWRAELVDGRWHADWGGAYPLDGDGSSAGAAYGDGPGLVEVGEPLSRGTGSGISSLAGLLRIDELRRQEVEHALAFVTDSACGPPQEGPHRWPATTTDGTVRDAPCIPQGSRVQLDPELDLDSLDLTPVERTVARALQVYGAYAVDNGDVRFAVVTEAPRTSAQRTALRELGVEGDFHYLDGLPRDRFRVLASWNGR